MFCFQSGFNDPTRVVSKEQFWALVRASETVGKVREGREALAKGDKATYDRRKKGLPLMIFIGTFDESERTIENKRTGEKRKVKGHWRNQEHVRLNGLVVADYDHLQCDVRKLWEEAYSRLSDEDKAIYTDKLDLNPTPFENVTYYYPYGKDQLTARTQSYAAPSDIKIQMTKGKAKTYKFVFDKCQDKLDLLLANEDDSSGTMESCVNYIINHEGQFKGINKWSTFQEAIDECTKTGTNGGTKNEIMVTSWRKFKRCIGKAINNDVFAKDILNNSEVDICDEISQNLKKNQVMVIDIARLDENTQSFVFGSVARAIYDLKLGAERDNIPHKVIMFVDELNKYASNDVPKNSPILKQLLDIAERGRSLGIILFSVEQFRSAIHDRVKGNCATAAYGRTNAIEVSKPDYRYFPKTYQNMMTRLSPGEYIISNPALRSLINVRFPRPTYKQFPNG